MNASSILRCGIVITVLSSGADQQLPVSAATYRCAERVSWASRRVLEMPRTLDGLLKEPAVYRRALFSRFSPKEMAAVWKDQLLRYRIARGDELSAGQLGVLDRVLTVLRPEIYADQELAKASLGPLESEIVSWFSTTERAVFTVIGFGFQSTPDSVVLTQHPDCNCSSGPPDCGPDWYCDFMEFCNYVSQGCGYTGVHPCTGTCKPVGVRSKQE